MKLLLVGVFSVCLCVVVGSHGAADVGTCSSDDADCRGEMTYTSTVACGLCDVAIRFLKQEIKLHQDDALDAMRRICHVLPAQMKDLCEQRTKFQLEGTKDGIRVILSYLSPQKICQRFCSNQKPSQHCGQCEAVMAEVGEFIKRPSIIKTTESFVDRLPYQRYSKLIKNVLSTVFQTITGDIETGDACPKLAKCRSKRVDVKVMSCDLCKMAALTTYHLLYGSHKTTSALQELFTNLRLRYPAVDEKLLQDELDELKKALNANIICASAKYCPSDGVAKYTPQMHQSVLCTVCQAYPVIEKFALDWLEDQLKPMCLLLPIAAGQTCERVIAALQLVSKENLDQGYPNRFKSCQETYCKKAGK